VANVATDCEAGAADGVGVPKAWKEVVAAAAAPNGEDDEGAVTEPKVDEVRPKDGVPNALDADVNAPPKVDEVEADVAPNAADVAPGTEAELAMPLSPANAPGTNGAALGFNFEATGTVVSCVSVVVADGENDWDGGNADGVSGVADACRLRWSFTGFETMPDNSASDGVGKLFDDGMDDGRGGMETPPNVEGDGTAALADGKEGGGRAARDA